MFRNPRACYEAWGLEFRVYGFRDEGRFSGNPWEIMLVMAQAPILHELSHATE